MKWIKIGLFTLYSYSAIYLVASSSGYGSMLTFCMFIPLCIWLTVLIHELVHYICFKIFGFSIKELRIGLFTLKFEKSNKKIQIADFGFFFGFCSIDRNHGEKKIRLILSLMAGGVSGVFISLVSFAMIMSGVVPNKWMGIFISFICVGLYSFYATLLSPRSADRKLIEKIMKE